MSHVAEKKPLVQLLDACFGERTSRYEELLHALREAGIEFVLINLPINYQVKQPPSDLDLLLDDSGYAAAGAYLEGLGFLRLDREPGPRQVVYVGHAETGGFIRVHLHEHIVFHGLTLLTYRCALDYTIEIDGCRCADEHLEYYLLHVQWFFKNKPDYPRRIEELTTWCALNGLPEAGERLFGRCYPLIEQIVRRRSAGVGPTRWQRLHAVTRLGGGSTWRYLLRRLQARLPSLPFKPRRGIMVFLMGIDGSGKTTLARNVVNQHDRGGLFCHYRYFGLKETLVQRLRQRLLPRDPHEHKRGQRGIVDAMAGISGAAANLFNLLLSVVYIVEFRLRCLKLMRPIRRQNDLLVVDRTYLDKLMEPDRWGNKLFYYLLPHPDIVVALYGQAELLHRRKPEFALPVLQEMQVKMDRAWSFLEKQGVALLRIDTTERNIDAVTAKVQARLWHLVTNRENG